MKKNLVGIFFSVLLFVVGCHEKKVENTQYISIQPQEVKPIKKALIEGFNLYDSALVKNNRYAGTQNPKDFYSYVSELEIEGTYFDQIIEGYSIKRFYCESLKHPFCLIRDTANNLYYFSNSDAFRYLEIFGDTLCIRSYAVRLSHSDTLFVYEDSASVELAYLRNIIRDMNFKKDEQIINKRYVIERMLHAFYLNTFRGRFLSTFCQVSYPRNVNSYELQKLYKKREGVDVNNLYRIEEELSVLNTSSISGTSEIFIENYGVVIIYYYENENTIKLKKYFITQLEIPISFAL